VKAKATVSVSVTTGLLDAIEAAGGNPDEVIQLAGLKRSALANPDAFIPSAAFAQALEEASRSTRDGTFGLHFGELFDPRDLGALTYVVVNSPDVATAMRNVERYVHIHNTAARVVFNLEQGKGYLRYLVSGDTKPPRQQNEYSMALLVRTFRLIGGDAWQPSQINFTHDMPAATSEHARIFRCPVLFGSSENAIVVEHDFIERLVPAADEKLYRVLKQHVEHILSEIPVEDDLLTAVKRAIGEFMTDGEPKRERVAGRLAMSARTLERRLKDRGVVYKTLVDDMRRRFALDYLRDRRHTVTEVAFLLGYSEVSAFNRAFRRWTGSTPSDYREQNAR
jgi:AraC-like DNA-binding protein